MTSKVKDSFSQQKSEFKLHSMARICEKKTVLSDAQEVTECMRESAKCMPSPICWTTDPVEGKQLESISTCSLVLILVWIFPYL